MKNTLPPRPQPKFIPKTQKMSLISSNSLKMVVVGLLILLPIVTVGGYLLGKNTTKNDVSLNDPIVIVSPMAENGIVCTADAKFCPDGSSVRRTGPNCEFEECPVTAKGGVLRLTVPTNSKTLAGESRSTDLPVVPVQPAATPVRMTIRGVVYQIQIP